jgi:hypothetical protein
VWNEIITDIKSLFEKLDRNNMLPPVHNDFSPTGFRHVPVKLSSQGAFYYSRSIEQPLSFLLSMKELFFTCIREYIVLKNIPSMCSTCCINKYNLHQRMKKLLLISAGLIDSTQLDYTDNIQMHVSRRERKSANT